MIRIFISYRRDDSGYAAGWVYDRLKQMLGDDAIDIDIHSIPAAADYERSILESIDRAGVVLAFIGKQWLQVQDAQGARRLDDPTDMLRQEIEYALDKGIPIVPVLLEGAPMPARDELPGSIRALTRLNALPLRQSDFEIDLQRLHRTILMYNERPQLEHDRGAAGRITGEHLALLYSCWRAPQFDERHLQEVYRFDIIVEAEPDVLDRIQKVEYLLPPAWPTSPVTTTHRDRAFGLKELAWADLLVKAKIHLRDQDEPVFLSCHVRLSQHGPRLVKPS